MHIEPSCLNLFLFFFALAGSFYVGRELFAPGARQVVVALGAVCAVAAAIVALVC
jgi:phytoene/squalene synthetase